MPRLHRLGLILALIPLIAASISPVSGIASALPSVEGTLLPASFTVNITFEESGLPAGDSWSVTLNGATTGSTGTLVTFFVANASYSYSVHSTTGYLPVPSMGIVNATAGNLTQGVLFYPPGQSLYFVEFQSSGLPLGTPWSVHFGNYLNDSVGSTLGFSVANGTYGWTVLPSAGWTATPVSGSISVQGMGATLPIAFSRWHSNVTFSTAGLPTGTSWTLVFNATRYTLQNSSFSFREPNGSYPYSVEPPPGYSVAPTHGWANVSGQPSLAITLRFTAGSGSLYPVAFTETGLKAGTTWAVSVDGQTVTTANTSLLFALKNGTHSYLVSSVSGYSANPSLGTFNVTGVAGSVAIAFAPTSHGSTGIFGVLNGPPGVYLLVGLIASAIVALTLIVYRFYSQRSVPPDSEATPPPPASVHADDAMEGTEPARAPGRSR